MKNASFSSLAETSLFYIFDTHPIQYRAPVFQALAKRLPQLRIFFFNDHFDGRKWWFHEFDKIPSQNFALRLQQGYACQVLQTHQAGILGFNQKLQRLFKKSRPEAVVLYGYYLPEHWALWWVCQRYGIPVIFVGETFHAGGSFFRRTLKRFLHPLFFRGVFRFIAIGNRTEAFYRSLGIESKRILKAKYCVDTSFFRRDLESSKLARYSLRKQLGVPEDAFVLLFVGRLFERKRPSDFIALHKILSKDELIYSWLIGNGPDEEKLRKNAASLPRFSFLGFKSQPELRDFYCAADLLIVPSEYETWGLVVNEALSAGLPAAVTDQCGVANDLIIQNKTGFVCPVKDIEAFASAVLRLRHDPKLHDEMSRCGKEKVEKEYNVEQFAEALLRAYQEALTSNGHVQ